MPTNNNKMRQIGNCGGGNKLRCVSTYYLCTSSMPPQANDTMCPMVYWIWRLRERERERRSVCVMYIWSQQRASIYLLLYASPPWPYWAYRHTTYLTHHPCTRFHVLGHTVRLEELQHHCMRLTPLQKAYCSNNLTVWPSTWNLVHGSIMERRFGVMESETT